MEPAKKNQAIWNEMDKLMFGDSGKSIKSCIEQDICCSCSTPVNFASFKDNVSRKEYTISGLCQTCQDQVFGTEEE